MNDPTQWHNDVVIPALLRVARRTYGGAIREALAEVGCDDMPRNGQYVIGGLSRSGQPLGQLIRELGVSKQAAGQLVDTLVLRGYLERETDPDDRRRMTVTLTDRGQLAADAGKAAVEGVDAELTQMVGEEYVAHCRATLAALINIGDRAAGLA